MVLLIFRNEPKYISDANVFGHLLPATPSARQHNIPKNSCRVERDRQTKMASVMAGFSSGMVPGLKTPRPRVDRPHLSVQI